MTDLLRDGQGLFYSDVVAFNGIVFLSGMAATDPNGDLGSQSRDVFAQIDSTLKRAGSHKSRLLSVQVWLKNIRDWDDFNEFYAGWIDSANKPCRSTVQAELPDVRYLLKVACIAAQSQSNGEHLFS